MERENAEAGEPTENWHILEFDAVRQEEPPDIPETCTLEPDWRKPGEALCPERYDLTALGKIKAAIGDYHWNAKYQQRPVPREGALFKEEWFAVVHSVPVKAKRVRFWDTASGDGKRNDWTVGTLMAKYDGMYVVEDVVRFRKEAGERDKLIRATAEKDGLQVMQVGEQEPGASGKDQATAFKRNLDGFPVRVRSSSGDKVIRADPLASAAQVGNVKVKAGPWNKAWLGEICVFPFGVYDDQPDSASGAYSELSKRHVEAQAPSGWGQQSYWR